MDRARNVQLSAILQCCSSDMRPVQNQPSSANSNTNCLNMNAYDLDTMQFSQQSQIQIQIKSICFLAENELGICRTSLACQK